MTTGRVFINQFIVISSILKYYFLLIVIDFNHGNEIVIDFNHGIECCCL